MSELRKHVDGQVHFKHYRDGDLWYETDSGLLFPVPVSDIGTATDWGDIAETKATGSVFGETMPSHSLKSYFGHTLGACGGIEAWRGIEMLNEGWFAPTANLAVVDERCAPLDYVKGEGRRLDVEYLMSNKLAFGGINTLLVFRRMWSNPA